MLTEADARTPGASSQNSDLKFFKTSKLTKVGTRQVDLVKVDQRRRQAKFLLDNPTFRVNTKKLTENNNLELSDLAKNSLYFKSNTGRTTIRNMGQ